MTSTSNDMPPRQPNENEPADHPARDELDIIDEAVARITDDDIEKHLRQVLDRAGCRSGRAPGAQPPSGIWERLAATRRGRWLSWFLIALSGAAPEIVDKVPVERAKFESRGLAVLLSSVIAVVSMWFALTAGMGVNGIAAAPAGLLWGLAVMGIDRWLVTSIPLGGRWRRLVDAVPVLVLALLLGALISAPMVLHLFQQPIDTESSHIRQHQQHSAFVASPQYGPLNQQVTSLQTQVTGLSEVVASQGTVPLAPSADPQILALNAAQAAEIALDQKYIEEMALEESTGPGYQSPVREVLAYLNASDGWEHASVKVSELTNQIKTREEQLIGTGKAAAENHLQEALEELPAVKEKLTAAQERLTALRAAFLAQKTTGGVLTSLKALTQLPDLVARSASLLVFLLFLMIECLPVTVALVQRPGGYEKILARVIIDEQLKIEPAAQEHLQDPAAAAEELSAPLPAEVVDGGPGLPDGTSTAESGRGTESVAVPDHLRKEIESIDLCMNDMTETTAPAYREELENCLVSICQAVNELRRKGFDSDQIAEARRITLDTATRQLAAAWQERWRSNSFR
jgi:hypothetical protein